ncbi:hypothetical protein BHU72_05905 [Desulfuribacillus stibiiarsenatis]|uniref:DUF6602 domain-containing protein n=1 Tax=Desulfuribacillus stibiiarsenatis TaxID=1390249 RepID=A0A1E5L505_9FIRM|nr:DUF6602 domain-containing protein [Desulfuribacillus stibiiarsenatis]OEH85144.1 hypothetical protein BHU72_05905 [Desulfuribacillus stibiiarsenatis]
MGDIKLINLIAKNYQELESVIANQLHLQCEHPTVIGSFREKIWKSLFEQIVPKKFSIEQSVFIIDSEGSVSKEVDLAIFDEQYTPYIFNYGEMKFIPIEAVAVVIQCKSNSLGPEGISDWIYRIDKLKTCFNSIARMHSYIAINKSESIIKSDETTKIEEKYKQTQTSTRPIKILCHLNEKWTDTHNLKKIFDFTISTTSITTGEQGTNKLRLQVSINDDINTLAQAYKRLNHNGTIDNVIKSNEDLDISFNNYKVFSSKNEKSEKEEISILSLIFQLNQMLMLINNPLLFPHQAYVKMFNDHLELEG